MATSLARQLKQLRTPQTTILFQDKKHASLLFDPTEAANLDRETVLSIGQNGLQELIKLSDVFLEFEHTLFAQSSLNLERAVQDVKVNKKLDRQIEKFLILLSPYFLLNNAHKTLEWLICRYHIEEFNRDQFLLLILPYHETRMFARALQVLNLSDDADNWHWLEPLQKPGVPLATITLVNRLSCDNALLKLICNHVITATNTYSERASSLSTLYAFYTTSILGIIDQSPGISEVQMGHMLPTILKSLESSISDFAASSYMILAKLTFKEKLNDITMEKLLLKIFKKTHLKEEALHLLFFLYNVPIHQLTTVPKSLATRLSELSWFIELAIKLQSSNVNILKFIVSLLQTSCRMILDNPSETVRIQNMVNEILSRIKLDDIGVDTILWNVLQKEFLSTDMKNEAREFLIRLYHTLERTYPERFDDYLKGLMKRSETDKDSKLALEFVTSWHFGAKDTQEVVGILDKLIHINPVQRIVALEMLADSDVNIPESFQEMMTTTIQSRFSDTEVDVIKALLTISTKRLTSLLSADILIDELKILLSTCHTSRRKILAKPALKILLELCKIGDDTSVFITSLPYLFPNDDADVDIAMEVLESNFARNNIYMQHVQKDLGKSPNAEAVSSASFHNILNWELLPPTDSILSAMKQQISHGDAASMFFNLILLGSVCRVPVGSLEPQIAREVIEMATEMIKKYPQVKLLQNCNNITGDNIQMAIELTSQGVLPLQVGTYVLEMVHRRLDLKSNPAIDFENNQHRSNLILRLLEMFFEGIDNVYWCKHYSRCLQIFFQRHFSTIQDLIRFLSQLYIKPVKVQTSFHCLKITQVLLNQCKSTEWAFEDKVFVTNLLLSLARENNECRIASLKVLEKLISKYSSAEVLNRCTMVDPFPSLLQELVIRSSEISLDPDQLSLSLYILLSPDPDVCKQLKMDLRRRLQQAQQMLFEIVMDQQTPLHIKSQLLDILVHVNGPTILQRLVPLGLHLLEMLQTDSKNKSAGNLLKNILQRFNSTTVKALTVEQVWKLFEASIEEHKIQLITESGNQHPPSVILLKQIGSTFFQKAEEASNILQKKIIAKLVDVATDCEIGNIISSTNRAMRKIQVNAQLIVDELQIMKDLKNAEPNNSKMKNKRRISLIRAPDPTIINRREWKRGVTLLEFVQQADNIEHEELLYPILFNLLKTCLSFEEQSPIEYTNQLLLSTIHRLTVKKLPIRDAHLQIDLITQCIRTSRNPQTHHHALLVLVELLKIVDVRCALYTIMPIFTFMGSSVVRQDDAYSIQIISKTIETVVPIINAVENETHACEVLRTFIVSLPDIPEHRRTPLFVKLLQLLDNHFHLYYLLSFESHVMSRTMRITNQKTPEQRLEFALQVSQEFPPTRLIQVCVKLAQFLKELPVDVEDEEGRRAAISFKYKHIFDVSTSSPKHLRHYKYTLVQFLSNLLSSTHFINKVAEFDSTEVNNVRPYYDQLIVELIILIQCTSKNADKHQGKPIAKYWKVLLHHLYDVLDLVNNLLPNGVFLVSIKRLIEHDLLTVKRKALDLLNTRLQQRKFNEEDHEDLLQLIESLSKTVSVKVKSETQEQEIVQQTVLITIKLLAKLLASDHPILFKPILETTTELLGSKEGPVLASAALCVAELCSSMRIHAIHSLNKFVPAILHLLEDHCHQDVPDVIVVSIVSALQKIVESVGNFLSLYLDQLLFELARLNSLYTDTEHQKIGIVISRLNATTQKLSTCIPSRVLLPAVNRTYMTLLAKKLYQRIPALMNVLVESFNSAQPNDINAVIPDLGTFFLKVLQFREDISNSPDDMEVDESELTLKDVVVVEESASKALVALVLKLSETTFRPLYYKLYDWAARNPQYKERNITFYRLSANIAECLKSLFVLFAGHFIKHAAILLSSNNPAIIEEPQEMTLPEESSKIELVEAILLTLYRVFSYDAHNFVSQERFEILAQPIVDQLENTLGSTEGYEKRASELVVPCIAAFASAIPDDSLHKQLVYQTLLKTRHTKPYVRTAALNALVEIVRKLGEDFMPLLPETIPFLAEVLEDEDETTEKCAQNAVRTLEEILGEPLQKYF
ncbi:HEAT repeat-containing protein 1 [Bombus pascuorum]|uniref:HEAT repeat-containing protein 1 n=1 Tax=Bombus pascuorum TaxID=65598 RepID=UPI00212A3EC2|nr:HEAT repeat-containing protein 1 [Bombus pascuorum]XP_060815513.1 HEAT repeat-containing protein 1 [Bombus pascuorum]